MHHRPDPFEAFFHKHVRWVTGEAARIVGDRDAEDVAQEVFFRVSIAMARGDFDPEAPAWAYLRVATHRSARDHYRRIARERPTAEDKELHPMDETLRGNPERALAVRLQWDEMLDLLDALAPERRHVWVMAEIEQMTLAEIAAILEISPNTVSTRLQLARADFEAAVARRRAASRRAGVPLLLPLDAAELARTARALPMPDPSASAVARIWRGVQDRRARYEASPGVTSRGPRLRLTSAASHGATLALGIGLGLILSMRFVDIRGEQPISADPEIEPVPVAIAPSARPPTAAESEIEAPTDSASSAAPPAGASETELPELRLIEQIRAALEPPAPDPRRALRLLDDHRRRYPRSRRYAQVIARLRQEAERLAGQDPTSL